GDGGDGVLGVVDAAAIVAGVVVLEGAVRDRGGAGVPEPGAGAVVRREVVGELRIGHGQVAIIPQAAAIGSRIAGDHVVVQGQVAEVEDAAAVADAAAAAGDAAVFNRQARD